MDITFIASFIIRWCIKSSDKLNTNKVFKSTRINTCRESDGMNYISDRQLIKFIDDTSRRSKTINHVSIVEWSCIVNNKPIYLSPYRHTNFCYCWALRDQSYIGIIICIFFTVDELWINKSFTCLRNNWKAQQNNEILEHRVHIYILPVALIYDYKYWNKIIAFCPNLVLLYPQRELVPLYLS